MKTLETVQQFQHGKLEPRSARLHGESTTKMLALRTTRSVLWVLRRPPQRPGQKGWAEKGIFQGIAAYSLENRCKY